jgi:hypothetical protein
MATKPMVLSRCHAKVLLFAPCTSDLEADLLTIDRHARLQIAPASGHWPSEPCRHPTNSCTKRAMAVFRFWSATAIDAAFARAYARREGR